MHRDVGLGKLGEAGKEVRLGFCGNGHDHVRGSRPIDQLVEAVEPAENRDRVRPGMDGQVAAPEPRPGQVVVAGVDEADDRHAPAGCRLQVMQQLPGVAPGTDQDDPVASVRGSCPPRRVPTREFQGIIS